MKSLLHFIYLSTHPCRDPLNSFISLLLQEKFVRIARREPEPLYQIYDADKPLELFQVPTSFRPYESPIRALNWHSQNEVLVMKNTITFTQMQYLKSISVLQTHPHYPTAHQIITSCIPFFPLFPSLLLPLPHLPKSTKLPIRLPNSHFIPYPNTPQQNYAPVSIIYSSILNPIPESHSSPSKISTIYTPLKAQTNISHPSLRKCIKKYHYAIYTLPIISNT